MKLITLTPIYCEIRSSYDEVLAVAYRSHLPGVGWRIVNQTTGKDLAIATRKKFVLTAFEQYLNTAISKLDYRSVLN